MKKQQRKRKELSKKEKEKIAMLIRKAGNLAYLIGIDPGSRKRTGFSLKNLSSGKLERVESMSMFDCLKTLELLASQKMRFGVVLEDANEDSLTYSSWQIMSAVLLRTKSWQQNRFLAKAKEHFGIETKKSQAVGKVKALCQQVIDVCDEIEIPCLLIAPGRRQSMEKVNHNKPELLRMPTKVKADAFNRITGWIGKSNEHGRDAGTLIYRANCSHFSTKYTIQANKTTVRQHQ